MHSSRELSDNYLNWAFIFDIIADENASQEVIQRSNALERKDLEDLRKVSRQEYLMKREQKKLEEIKDDIEDGQYLFDGVKLTVVEYCEPSDKKQIYELVKKRSDEVEDTTEYKMPDVYDEEGGVNQEKRFSIAVQCYKSLFWKRSQVLKSSFLPLFGLINSCVWQKKFRAAFGAPFIWLVGLIYFPRFGSVTIFFKRAEEPCHLF